MNEKEIIHVIIAIIILSIVISFTELIQTNFYYLGTAIIFASIIIITNVLGKKVAASFLDASVEHSILSWSRYGFKPDWHLKKEIPSGAILPLVFSAFSLGYIKVMAILTYDTSALKRRAAKRFGHYSYTEMTDFHTALVGAGGIVITLLLAFITYWTGPETLARMAAFYAFWNMIPVSKFDGTQIYFGSRVLWTILTLITLLFAAYAIFTGIY
ncbi:hypothetical protein AUJ84_00990 [Candidatus Pacearchaeota archaeon CG1_02_32_132]|nr:MAG: hypothetical protein AUJ84_00990 [Candidatus Pacearchaeota archaeon CG1_02_32_132]